MISSNALCNKLQFHSEFLCLSINLVLVVVQLFNDTLMQQVQPRTYINYYATVCRSNRARFPIRLAEVSAVINSEVQEPRADLLFNSHIS